jgi:hypothetical protein
MMRVVRRCCFVVRMRPKHFSNVRSSRKVHWAFLIAALFLVSLFTSVRTGQATWNKIAQFSERATCGYFFDANVGFICVGSTTTTAGIKFTSDGGASWRQVVTPPWSATGLGYLWFTDIWFANRLTGYCTFIYANTGANMWQTNDGGLTWTNSGYTGSPCAVRATSHALIVADYLSGIEVSTDFGTSWTIKSNLGTVGLSFTDDLHGSTGGFGPQNPPYFTTDGGLTWSATGSRIGQESWGVYGEPLTTKMFEVPENNSGGFIQQSVLRSTDNGQNWIQIQSLLFSPSGAIEGAGTTLFVQNTNKTGGAAGIFRSIDEGISWVNIGGPFAADFDISFVVTNCGSVLYAFDATGGIYRTIDGGDGTLINTCSLTSLDTLQNMTADLCDSIEQQFFIHNRSSDSLAVIDLRVIDSTRDPYRTHALHFDSIPAFYHIIKPTDSMGFSMGWHPNKYRKQSGTDSSKIRVIFYHLKSGKRDTVFYQLHLIILATTPQFALNTKLLQLPPIAICTKVDTSIQLINQGCDTLKLNSAFLKQRTDWLLFDKNGKPLVFPIFLPKGTTTTLSLRFTPRSKNGLPDSLMFLLSQFGQDTSIFAVLAASSTFVSPIITSDSLYFDSVSTCSSSEHVWTFGNAGCDSLIVTGVDLNSTDWIALGADHNPLALPITVRARDSLASVLRFVPSVLGARSDVVTIHYRYFGYDTSFTIKLSGVGKSVGGFDHVASIDFGKVSECLFADSVIVFHNSMCQALTIDSMWTSGAFTADLFALPLTLQKNSSLRIPIHFIVRKRGIVNGEVFVRATVNAKSVFDSIPVTGNGVAGTSALLIKPSLDSLNFPTRSTCTAPDSIVFICFNPGCDTLSLISATIEGSCAALKLATSLMMPAILLTGDTCRMVLLLSPTEGKYQGDLKLSFMLADGSTHDSIIPITASVTRGTRTLQLDTTAIDLGTVAPCATRDTEIVYTNTGCAPMTIRSRTLSNGAIISLTSLSGSMILKPGQSDTIHLRYDGSHVGQCNSSLAIHTDADRDSVGTIPLTINIPPVDSVFFAVKLSSHLAGATEIISASLVPDRAVKGKSLNSISGVLSYYNDAFDLVGTSSMSGLMVVWSPSYLQGNAMRMPFRATSASEIVLDPATAILAVNLKVVITDSTMTSIALDSLMLNSDLPSYGRCVLSSVANGTVFTRALTACADTILVNHLNHRTLFETTQIHPDPVYGTSAKLGVLSQTDGTITIVLRDQLGRVVRTSSSTAQANTSQELLLDLNKLPTGSYYYSVEFRAAADGAIETRSGSVFIMK